MSRTPTAAAILFSLAFAPSAFADARDAVMQAFEKAMADGSYRAQMTSEYRGKQQQSTLQMQGPDRFHMKNADTEVIVLPGGTWMNAGGQWMKLPMDMSQMIRGMTVTAMRDGANLMKDVKQLGSENVNGCDATLYAYRADGKVMGFKSEADVTVAICGSSGLPVRVISTDLKGKSRTVIDYDYDAPVDIRAPN